MSEISVPITGAEARKKIKEGVKVVYDTVKLTLGPEGGNAILPRTFNRGPRITNDGVTISENVRPKDEYVRIVADAFKEGSKKTNELIGDGTTTTATLAGHLTLKVLDEMGNSDIPTVDFSNKPKSKGKRAIRGEMKEAKDKVIEEIKKLAKPIASKEELERIAAISIGKEDMGAAKIVADLVWEIGRDGSGKFIDNHVDVVEGYKGILESEVIRGMRFPAKVAARAFVNRPDRMEMVAEDVRVLLTNYKIENPFQFVQILNNLKVANLAVFAPDFSTQVLKSIIEGAKNGVFVYPVKCPALRTDVMEDLGAYIDARVIDKDSGAKLEAVKIEDLGFATKIVVKDTEIREDAVLLGGKGEKVKRGEGNAVSERVEVLKSQLKLAQNDLTKITLQKRIAGLHAAVGVIRVGSTTSAEGLYLKLKIEDGVYACKAALEEGYVKGGGLCLKEIAETLPENILTESLKAPYEQIQKNAGGVLEIADDVIDPAKAVRLEVEHGVSIASILITTDILIPEEREKSPNEGTEAIARAISKGVYYDAKHRGMIKESEDEAEADREKAFSDVLLADKG